MRVLEAWITAWPTGQNVVLKYLAWWIHSPNERIALGYLLWVDTTARLRKRARQMARLIRDEAMWLSSRPPKPWHSWYNPFPNPVPPIFCSGKLIVCYGKSPSLIGKSTINWPFSIAICNKLPEGNQHFPNGRLQRLAPLRPLWPLQLSTLSWACAWNLCLSVNKKALSQDRGFRVAPSLPSGNLT
jgi:hypothetical protein